MSLLRFSISGAARRRSAIPGNVSALEFSGSHTRMPVGLPAAITSAITLEAWFRVSNVSNNNVILEKAAASHSDPFYIYNLVAGNGGQVRFDLTFAGTRYPLVSASSLISANVWHHVAGTYDGADMRLYLDGTQVASQAQTGSIDSNSQNVYIGSHGNIDAERTAGQIDEVRIWNVARSQAQIAANMALNIAAQSNLVAAWSLNENAGTTTADVTGALSPASLTAGVSWYNATLPF